jgi:hypothetical protein
MFYVLSNFFCTFAARVTSTSAPSKGGMQLGKSTKTNQFLESLKAEGEVIVEDVAPGPLRSVAAAPIISDPILVGVEEKLVVVLKKDGGLENLEVQGSMSLVVQKEEDAYIRVQVLNVVDLGTSFECIYNVSLALPTYSVFWFFVLSVTSVYLSTG